jgi:hypothetical protein
MKLNFDKASKEMNEETNPIGKFYNVAVEGGCYGRL